MDKSIPLLGQWLGYFEYGPEYGEELAGERVEFRLFADAPYSCPELSRNL